MKCKREDCFAEICENCGCTNGSHHGGTSPWPYNYCPGTEGRMDWENGPGTVFKPSGLTKEDLHETKYPNCQDVV